MDIIKQIDIFEKMDISNPFAYVPIIQKGKINVRDTEFYLRQMMYSLKKTIGELSDSAKLKHIINLNLLLPQNVVFNSDNDRIEQIQQVFFQQSSDWYDFIEGYKEYLSEKIAVANDTGSEQIADTDQEQRLDYNTQQLNNSFWDYNAKRIALDYKYLVEKITTKKLAESSNGRIKEGILGYTLPEIPNNPKDAFELFVNYYATSQFYLQQNLFFDDYRNNGNINAIRSEITLIEEFINEAEKINYKQACKEVYNPSQHVLYRRITGGYYETVLMTYVELNANGTAASVYGRYVLFYEYLKGLLKQKPSMDNGIIEDLTADRLKEYGFDEDTIEGLLSPDRKPHAHNYHKDDQIIVASSIEGKIYTGIYAARKFYFENGAIKFPDKELNLIPEYYDLLLGRFLNECQKMEKLIYIEGESKIWFHKNQISNVENDLKIIEEQINAKKASNMQVGLLLQSIAGLLKNKEQKEGYLKWLVAKGKSDEYLISLPSNDGKKFKGIKPFNPLIEDGGVWINPDVYKTMKGPGEPIEQLSKNLTDNSIPAIQSTAVLKLRQIALLYCYEEKSIIKGIGANKIAIEHGHKSGDKLYQLFAFYSDRRHRIKMVEGSKQETTFDTKVGLLESIIELLDNNAKGKNKAVDELNLLKASNS